MELPRNPAATPLTLALLASLARYTQVLANELKTVWEFNVRGCREAAFSKGGHMFAVVNGQNILVYNTYTAECLGTLRGHSGKVRRLLWGSDDTHLYSVGADGAVYDWKVRKLRCAVLALLQ